MSDLNLTDSEVITLVETTRGCLDGVKELLEKDAYNTHLQKCKSEMEELNRKLYYCGVGRGLYNL